VVQSNEEVKKELLGAFEPFEDFCKVMLDGFALITATGKVIKCNTLLAPVVGKKQRQILKAETFDELLGFYVGDKKLDLNEIMSSKNRIDEIRADNGTNNDLRVTINSFPFFSKADPERLIGSFLLIRDVTAEANVQKNWRTSEERSFTDPLTGLKTRSYFQDFLNLQARMMNDPERVEEVEMTIALFDIDFFKKVNDVYGHQAGDHVLKVISKLLKNTFRKSDVCCRYGGEEFLVLLPNTNKKDAVKAVEKFRIAVEQERIVFQEKHIPCTVSGGIAELLPDIETYEQTIGRADQALYFSKEAGRNQISSHDGSGISPVKLKVSAA
jgi:diguanylate cyclase (GGDEF)-like protein